MGRSPDYTRHRTAPDCQTPPAGCAGLTTSDCARLRQDRCTVRYQYRYTRSGGIGGGGIMEGLGGQAESLRARLRVLVLCVRARVLACLRACVCARLEAGGARLSFQLQSDIRCRRRRLAGASVSLGQQTTQRLSSERLNNGKHKDNTRVFTVSTERLSPSRRRLSTSQSRSLFAHFFLLVFNGDDLAPLLAASLSGVTLQSRPHQSLFVQSRPL